MNEVIRDALEIHRDALTEILQDEHGVYNRAEVEQQLEKVQDMLNGDVEVIVRRK